jgi:hypothetical protein
VLRASSETQRRGENERKSNRLGHGQTPLRDKNSADHTRRKVHPPLRLRGRFVMNWATHGNPIHATRRFGGPLLLSRRAGAGQPLTYIKISLYEWA